jgi:hypothetical protein
MLIFLVLFDVLVTVIGFISIGKSNILKYSSDVRLPDLFEKPEIIDGKVVRPKKPNEPIKVEKIEDLRHLFKQGYRIPDLDVRGDTKALTKPHPVVRALHKRIEQNSIPGQRDDNLKIAIAIEGGGMRGCVAAGMITVIC